MAGEDLGLKAKKSENFAEWYPEVVLKAGLADYSPVKGCMIIKPHGYAIWELIQQYFNKRLKELGVKNAYFPLFIPERFFKKEAEHAAGFKPEVAWIEAEKGEERLAVRPTSETIMYDAYARWIRSWRDLPLKINQWCNVVRWETKATKLFLRTREFLWQEGHCVYATKEECEKETYLYLKEYERLCKELLAIPVIPGKKTEQEKFAGADFTLTVEAFMPDGRALQMGTSHSLGQNFAKAFGIKYMGKDEKEHYAWQNSWGFSTRLIGAVIMMHGDDKGLILPPGIAPVQAVIVPIYFKDAEKKKVFEVCEKVKKELENSFRVEFDSREEYTPGFKFNDWELKGVPIRIEIGPKDVAKKQVVIVRRDTGAKVEVKLKDVANYLSDALEKVHKNLYERTLKHLKKSIVEVKDYEQFKEFAEKRMLLKCGFCGKKECEERIKEETGLTSRCIPINAKEKKCIICGKKGEETYFSKGY